MAMLGTYYGLCPLIDHRSLLGISEDEEKGLVIVTLGKNIAIKFKLSDQKQLHSWRTKEKFTSPIIFDKEQSKYVAVFNEAYIRMWSGNEEFLDKLKKIKFNYQIHTIFSCNNKSFIVFKNGAIYVLNESIEKRKELHTENIIDTKSDFIIDVLYANSKQDVYIGLVVKSNENFYLCWTKFIVEGEHEPFCKIKIYRDSCEMKGQVFHVDNRSVVNFLTLWNDGRIYSVELQDNVPESKDVGELFFVTEAISCKEYVSLTHLDQNYVAMYGCNTNEEGALLVIYNVQFKVIQSRQSFKLFTNGAKMCCIDNNLFFPVGQNLAVIPFYLDTEQLAALIGSHKVIENEPDPDVSIVHTVKLANWGQQKSQKNDVPQILKSKIMDFVNQGLSENMIFSTILIDIIEKRDVDILFHALTYFSDIPEKCLADVLKFVLNVNSDIFKKGTHSTLEDYPSTLQPIERTELLDIIFTKSFNETLILPHLRSVLTLSEVLSVLQYICLLLSDNGHSLPSLNCSESEAKLIVWSCVLLDANYQKFIFTRDSNIKEILCLLKDHIKEELNAFDDMKFVLSLLNEIKKGKPINKLVHVDNLNYSVEEFPLY